MENTKEFIELRDSIYKVIERALLQQTTAVNMTTLVANEITRFLILPTADIVVPRMSKRDLALHFKNGEKLYSTSPRFNAMLEQIMRGANGFALMDDLLTDLMVAEQLNVDTLVTLGGMTGSPTRAPRILDLIERLHNKNPKIYA